MKQRLIAILLVLVLAAAAFSVTAGAVETASGACGENMTWVLEDGVLTISGSGAMDDCTGGAPWSAYKDSIHRVILSGKITYIGAEAFQDYDNLTAVDFGASLYEIGPRAFQSCGGLTSVTMPETFKIFGESCFQSCGSLKEIHCGSQLPSFRENALWNTWLTVYYPAETPWSEDYINQLEAAFKGRVTFLASDGSDPYAPQEPEPIPTETTQPEVTEPPSTQPPVTTQPEVTAPPVTQAPETPPDPAAPPASTGPEATAPEAPGSTEEGGPGWIMWLVIAVAVGLVCLVMLVLLVNRWKYSGHGKYSARR